jgi:hypothetical protein
VKARSLPPKLVEIIRKGADKKLRELADEGKYQVMKIYEYYNDVMEHNNLIPAWKEIQQARKLLDSEKDSMKLFQKAGKVKYTIEEHELRLELIVTIPQEYPYNPLKVVIQKSNADDQTTNIFDSHIQELVRRYHAGYNGLESDINEGKIGENTKLKFVQPIMSYAEIQYDVEFLRQQADMKEATDDKHVRKKYRRIMRKEAQKELEKLEVEEKRIAELQANNKTARPCLYEVIDFVINKLVRYFPKAL